MKLSEDCAVDMVGSTWRDRGTPFVEHLKFRVSGLCPTGEQLCID